MLNTDTDNDNDRYHAFWLPDYNSDTDRSVFKLSSQPSGELYEHDGNTTTNYYSGANRHRADMTFADIKVLSFYLNDEIELTDSDLTWSRFTTWTSCISTTTGSDTDDTISPRVGLIYDLTKQVSVYASYSETFAPKAGDQYAKVSSNDDKLDPDTFENTEIGLRLTKMG